MYLHAYLIQNVHVTSQLFSVFLDRNGASVPSHDMCLTHWCYFYHFLRSIRAVQAALHCIRKAIETQHLMSRPKVVVVSDTPSLVKSIVPNISEFAEVIFQYILGDDLYASVRV